MQFSREVETMFLFAQYGELMHEIVRGFSLKYGFDESLAQTPEIAWEWVLEGVGHGAPDLDVDARFQLASYCFQAIRDRMRRSSEGGRDGIH